jgi:hypothetical protein
MTQDRGGNARGPMADVGFGDRNLGGVLRGDGWGLVGRWRGRYPFFLL